MPQGGISDQNSRILMPIARHIFKPSFKDVKHMVSMFSNSERCDARKWVKDFEKACDSVNADDRTRVNFFRQFMKPDTEADLFLQSDSSSTYSELKENFLANFGHAYSVSEVIDLMRKTTFRSVKMSIIAHRKHMC